MADFWTDRQDGDIIEADDFNTAFNEIDKKIKSNVAGNTETLQALATHIADKENPHEVTAEQTGAYEKDSVYNKTEIDSKLVPVGTSETDVDLTTCSSGNGTTMWENITSNSLAASVGTITVTLDADKTYVVKGTTDSGGLELKVDGVMIAEVTSDNPTVSFEYSGKIGIMTAYFSGGGNVTFETFKEITPRDGFMTSADKAKLDGLPDDAYSKSETDSKIDLLSLKAEKNGEAIRISNACEWEQTADVSIASKNLIPYPYTDTTKTVNGVTFTDNGDAGVTVSGTPTGYADFVFATVSVTPGQTYTLLKNQTGANNVSFVISERTNQSAQKEHTSDSLQNTFTFTTSESTDNLIIRIKRTDNGIACTGTFKPQLELGTSATAYTPHVSDISSVAVKKYGKNLIPYPYAETTRTDNGITFTDNGDGSITANGTATDLAVFHLCYANDVPDIIGQTVTLSGCPRGGGENSYRLRYQQGGISSDTGNGTTFTVAIKGQMAIQFFAGQTANDLVFKPQFELGNAATDYELYKAPVTYTADSDGKVSGVTLGSDTTTLTTDTSGVIINAKYKKDITKAFEELEEKINLLSSPSTVANIETL